MSMAASVVTYTVRAEHAGELVARINQHLIPAARQLHGYRGFVLLDQGDGKRLAILLFDELADVRLAQQVLSPIGEEQTAPLMSSGAIGSAARVLAADGCFATTSG